ncbi:MAG TPA: hypothetical protein VKQ32_24460 [Polyangia bacterium]|nr:hypothetical protein [Polyangia bacterium]
MRRRRHISGLVLGAFSAALTVLPWLHTLHHRDDHIHVDGAIVYLHHEPGNDHGDDEDDDDASPGFDHPAHHGSHGRGALAHGSGFIMAGAIFIVPPPAVSLERPAPVLSPTRPTLALLRAPRLTRGPPATTRS